MAGEGEGEGEGEVEVDVLGVIGDLGGEVVPGPVTAAGDGLVMMFRVPADALGYWSGGRVLVRGPAISRRSSA